jgi:Xaa-Pro aminopeptidase
MTSKQHKISALLKLMAEKKINAYMVACQDEFQNEFPPEHNQRLKWLTSFSGSNGIAIITKTKSIFFTDGRYLVQAEQQLGEQFIICNLADKKRIKELSSELKVTINYDPILFSTSFMQYWEKIFAANQNINFAPVAENLIDILWQRPINYPTKAPMVLDSKYTSVSAVEKIKLIIEKFNTDYLLITDPTTICWLFNIRGNDTNYTPILMCYCLIKSDGNIELFSYLEKFKNSYSKLTLSPFMAYKERFLELSNQGCSIQLDKETPVWFWQNCQQAELAPNPCSILQAIKNPVELSGIEFAHRQDGVALIRLIKWLHDNSHDLPTELAIDQQLDKFKELGNLYMHKSFATIAGFAANSAIIHYNATDASNLKLAKNNILLLDSGSQYKAGTTDITRCFHFGTPTSLQKKHYSLVLKCLIKLSCLHFPAGTNGCQLDGIAREYLWRHGLDYPHSTGHGVGHYLGVHEGPMSISKNNLIPLQQNMVLSIEPGLYFPEQYGIRIENLVVVKHSNIKNFLCFETLTKVPIATNLIDFSLLSKQEISWLKNYHKKIEQELTPFLSEEEKVFLHDSCIL